MDAKERGQQIGAQFRHDYEEAYKAMQYELRSLVHDQRIHPATVGAAAIAAGAKLMAFDITCIRETADVRYDGIDGEEDG